MAIKTIVFASTLYFACFEAIAAPVVKSQELEELKASVRAVTTVDSVSNDVRRLWTIAFVVADRCRGFRANSGTRPVMPFEPSTPERTEAIRSVSRLFQQLDGPAEACREFYRAFGNGGEASPTG